MLPEYPGEQGRREWTAAVSGRLRYYLVPENLWASICESHMPPGSRPIEQSELVPLTKRSLMRVQRNQEIEHAFKQKFWQLREDDPKQPAKYAKLEPLAPITKFDTGAPLTLVVVHSTHINFSRFAQRIAVTLYSSGADRKSERFLACFQGKARDWVLKHVPNAESLRFSELVEAVKNVPTESESRLKQMARPMSRPPRSDTLADFKLYVNQCKRKIAELKMASAPEALLKCFAGEAREWIQTCIPHCEHLPMSKLVVALKRIPPKPRDA